MAPTKLEKKPKFAYKQFSNEILILSLAGTNEVDGRRWETCMQIVKTQGLVIFQVVDHGVDIELVPRMTRLIGGFFALPPEEKLRFDVSVESPDAIFFCVKAPWCGAEMD